MEDTRNALITRDHLLTQIKSTGEQFSNMITKHPKKVSLDHHRALRACRNAYKYVNNGGDMALACKGLNKELTGWPTLNPFGLLHEACTSGFPNYDTDRGDDRWFVFDGVLMSRREATSRGLVAHINDKTCLIW